MTSGQTSPHTIKDRIEQWREETSLTSKRYHGVLARLSDTCLGLLRILIKQSSPTWIPTPEKRTLRHCHSMLQLWEHGHGVIEGKLDDHLKQSRHVRQATIEVLVQLLECLLEGNSSFVLPHTKNHSIIYQNTLASELYRQRAWYLNVEDESSSESEDDSDDDKVEDDVYLRQVRAIVRRVKTCTDCIMGLGTALDCPAPDITSEDEAGMTKVVPRFAHDYHTDLIRAKYPAADIQVLQDLGRISWSRFLRMTNERDQNMASSAARSIDPVSECQDERATPLPPTAQSSYAESTVPLITSISCGERVKIPPMPEEGRKGLPFECIACGTSVHMTTSLEWREHVYTDLQPYTCLYHECESDTKPFSDRQAWADHLELEHKFGPAWRIVSCPLCSKTTGPGKYTILTHFTRHMEDIALVALPPAVEPVVALDASVRSSDSASEDLRVFSAEEGDERGTKSNQATSQNRLLSCEPAKPISIGGTKVWFCCRCTEGPCGDWQNVCTACTHPRCNACITKLHI